MKKLQMVISGLVFLATASLVQAADGDAQAGKKLFNAPQLGGSENSRSCASCHKDGDLSRAGSRADLKSVINTCIERPLRGKALADDSQAMKDLVAYIKSLGTGL